MFGGGAFKSASSRYNGHTTGLQRYTAGTGMSLVQFHIFQDSGFTFEMFRTNPHRYLSALCTRRAKDPFDAIIKCKENSPIKAAARGMLVEVAKAWNILLNIA